MNNRDWTPADRIRHFEQIQSSVRAAARRCGWDPSRTDDTPGDWLANRVTELEGANDSLAARAAEMSYETIRKIVDNMREALGCESDKNPVEVARAMRVRVAALERATHSVLPSRAGDARKLSIYKIIDPGYSDTCYLVQADGKHLPVFHIRDDLWGRWAHHQARGCQFPNDRISVQVVNCTGLSIAPDQSGKVES